MDLIGYDFAKEHGFTVHSFSGDKTSVHYINEDGIYLIVCYQHNGVDLEATLEFCYKLLSIKQGPFSLPNKNFNIFFKQIQMAHWKLNYA